MGKTTRKTRKDKPAPKRKKQSPRPEIIEARKTASTTPPSSSNSGQIVQEASCDPIYYRFSETHEWVRIKDSSTIVVGLTEFALQRLHDLLSIDLPEPDEHHYEAGDDVGSLEALNSSLSLHAPVAGTVLASNTDVIASPDLIIQDPYDKGWLFEMRPDKMEDLQLLMDYDEYEGHMPEDEEE